MTRKSTRGRKGVRIASAFLALMTGAIRYCDGEAAWRIADRKAARRLARRIGEIKR